MNMKQIMFYSIVVLALISCNKQEPELEILEDDKFEENDLRSNAAQLEEGIRYLSLTISEDDDDWYALIISADSVTIECRFIHEEGDINLEIFDESGDSLTSATSITDDEALSYNVESLDQFRTHYMHLYTSSPKLQKYTLFWDDRWTEQAQ